jgi:hypothetical protein
VCYSAMGLGLAVPCEQYDAVGRLAVVVVVLYLQ